MFLADWSGVIQYGWNVLCLPCSSSLIICGLWLCCIQLFNSYSNFASQSHTLGGSHSCHNCLTITTHLETLGREKKEVRGEPGNLPESLGLGGHKAVTTICHIVWLRWISSHPEILATSVNFLPCDTTPIATLQQAGYYPGPSESCKIKSHVDPTSNSSGGKWTSAKILLINTCPDLTVPLCMSAIHPVLSMQTP